jgi:integrase
MRPREIRHLKVQNINADLRQIRIVGKSGDRLVPIPDQLLALLNKRKAFDNPANFYVFGRAGTVSGERMSKDYLPGLYATIKAKVGLGDEYGLYSWKPTGVQDMILAGF